MTLNFPDSPSLNDTYTSPSGVNFVWDGVKWRSSNDPTFDSLTVDTDTLYVDAANSKVGIGTTTPDTALHISGTGVNDSRMKLTRSGGSGVVGVIGNDLLLSGVGTDDTDGGIQFFAGGSIKASLLSGGGLCFGSDNTQANALNDYEEGTFTPTIEGGTAYTYQDGYYTKVGDVVHFWLRVWASAATGNSNRWNVHGLPFSSIDAASYGGAFRNYGDNLSMANFADLNFHIARNSSSIRAYDSQGTIYANSANVQLTRQIILQGFYKTA